MAEPVDAGSAAAVPVDVAEAVVALVGLAEQLAGVFDDEELVCTARAFAMAANSEG